MLLYGTWEARMSAEKLLIRNPRLARRRWKGEMSRQLIELLDVLTRQHALSIADNDLILLNSGWYVTHSGLLRLALRNRCAGIDAHPVESLCDPQSRRWAFAATVYKTKTCRGFVGY